EQSSNSQLVVVCAVDDTLPRTNGDVALSLYRVVQEALHNVQRHSRANRVFISLQAEDSCLKVSVADNGSGFAPNSTLRGLGLQSMKDRLHGIGGNLSVISSPGEGTTVLATVPLRAAVNTMSASA